VSAFTGNNR